MARLRIRIELNRGGVGVPLHKLSHVVDEAHQFFRMLGEDIHIGKDSGEWLGFEFDPKSLNFTAEYIGAVSPAQVREFYAAFDGVTLLRRATIAQFARIADGIDEDELIGFGLYQDDRETEPGEWRSLSKREALRITEEIRLLLNSADGESRIPAALDPNVAASLFKGRDHGVGERRLEGLAERVERLEQEVSGNSESIKNLRGTTAKTEQNLQNLLVAVDSFCDKATRQMERLPEPPAGSTGSIGWRIPATVAAVCVIGGWMLFQGVFGPKTSNQGVQAADPVKTIPMKPVSVKSEPPAVIKRTPVAEKPAAPLSPNVQRIELKAVSPTWVGVYIDDKMTFGKLLETDQTKTIESPGLVRVRVGNAAGIEMTANGKPVGVIGPSGKAKTVRFAGGDFAVE